MPSEETERPVVMTPWKGLRSATVEAERQRCARRDTFAAAALTGLLAAHAGVKHFDVMAVRSQLADFAWQMADAMEDAREQREAEKILQGKKAQ